MRWFSSNVLIFSLINIWSASSLSQNCNGTLLFDSWEACLLGDGGRGCYAPYPGPAERMSLEPSKVYPKCWWFNKPSKKEPPPSRDLHSAQLLIDVKNSNQTLDLVDDILDDLSLLPREIMDINPWQVYSKPNQDCIPLWFGKDSLPTLGHIYPKFFISFFFVREILHIRIAVYYFRSFGVMQKVCVMFGRNSQVWSLQIDRTVEVPHVVFLHTTTC